MCRSMVDIQSATAEIRRGKKKKKPQDKNIMAPYYIVGHNKYHLPIDRTFGTGSGTVNISL